MPNLPRAQVLRTRILTALLAVWLAYSSVHALGAAVQALSAAGPGAWIEAVTMSEARRIRRALERAAPEHGEDPALLAELDQALRVRAPLDATVVLLGSDARRLAVDQTFLRVLWMPRYLLPMLDLPADWRDQARRRPGPTYAVVLADRAGRDLTADGTILASGRGWTLWQLDEDPR